MSEAPLWSGRGLTPLFTPLRCLLSGKKWGIVLTLGLHGSHFSTLDSKGRVAVPARFRPLLAEGGQVMLTFQRDPCILVYSLENWQSIARSLAGTSPFDDEANRRKRLLFGNASACALDRQGRVLVPPPLRSYALLAKDVVWLGVEDRAEIWDRARWQSELVRGSR